MKGLKMKKRKVAGEELVPIGDIRPAPENDKLYRPVLATDPEIKRLAESIRENGLCEPIVLSLDGFVISGHRRLMACRLARLKEVRCRRENVSRADDPERFVRLLREYNRQRVKSLDEQLRESVVDINPEEARAELVLYRREKSKVVHDRLSILDEKKRRLISPAKFEFCDAIVGVLDDRRDYWPMSDRSVHYALLNSPPLKHSSKPDSRYQNDHASYKSLVELLTRMRLEGRIPFRAISDETRPFVSWDVHRDSGAFIHDQVANFLKGFYRDLVQSQPNHVEVIVEKNTVAKLVKDVCSIFTLPMTSGRGYCSLAPRAEMAQRYKNSGKEKLVLLLVSDFDPDGEAIAESFARSMRDDFGIPEDLLHPVKVALTYDQVTQLKLPPSLEAKTTSSRSAAFIEQFGTNVWELEALPPETLQQIVRDAIESVLEMELFNAEQQREADDAARLQAVRETLKSSFQSLN